MQFCVPKAGLNRPGTIFWDKFLLPTPPEDDKNSKTEGASEANPIVLPVSKAAFKAFLRVLYPLYACSHLKFTVIDEWIDRDVAGQDCHRNSSSGFMFWIWQQCGGLLMLVVYFD